MHWDNLQFLDELLGDRDGGVILSKVVLDPNIGEETAIFLVDKTPFVHEIAKLEPFTLNIVSGVFPCPSGPVLFVLYCIANPDSMALRPYATYECTYNPHNPTMVEPLQNLDKQAYWHVFIVGPDYEVLNWFEFRNEFNLQETLTSLPEIIRENPCSDFIAAKKEFEQNFPIDNLFSL